jgi:DNA-binding transcriptional ArsR family regulator
MGMADVAALLSASNQTGALRVTQGFPLGSVYFWLGQMVHAENGALQGLDALGALATYTRADFTFDVQVAPSGQSLAIYSTQDLIENIRQQVEEMGAIMASLPAPGDVLRYATGKQVGSLQGSPAELSLLLLANGQRTVADLARESQMDIESVRFALARFRRAGVVDVVSRRPGVAAPVPGPAPAAAPSAHVNGGKPLVWRGRKM